MKMTALGFKSRIVRRIATNCLAIRGSADMTSINPMTCRFSMGNSASMGNWHIRGPATAAIFRFGRTRSNSSISLDPCKSALGSAAKINRSDMRLQTIRHPGSAVLERFKRCSMAVATDRGSDEAFDLRGSDLSGMGGFDQGHREV